MSSEATTGSEVTGTPPAQELADIAPQAPTPIGRRLDEPPRPMTPVPPPVPAPPPVVRAPGASAEHGETPAEGIAVTEAPVRPRLARLYLSRINPWSAVKVGFMLSVAMAVIIIVAMAATWWLLDFSGTFLTVARTVDDIIGAGTTTLDIEALFAFGRIFGVSLVVAALEIVAVSALAGLFAVLYNLTVGITGGLEITFSDSV